MSDFIQGEFALPNPTMAEAEAARDAAMEQVEENSGQEWQEYAIRLIADVAREKGTFTSDDVMEKMEYKPHDCRALGPAMKSAQTLGLISSTDDYRPSTRRHCAPLRVWTGRQ